METITNDLVNRQTCPSYFPTLFYQPISDWINDVERLFKQPIKNVFPYPMDIIKVFDKSSGKLKKLIFKIALAGLSKDEIKVQIKNKKFLTIAVSKADEQDLGETEVEEYVSKGISYRDSEVTFRIIQEIDLEKFKPVFQNGLLTIDLYLRENDNSSDIITAEIN